MTVSSGNAGGTPIVVEEPSVTAVAIAPDNATDATTLTATPTGSNPEGGTLSFTYQWRHNGVAIAGATSSTLSLSTVTVAANDTFAVQVTPSDGTVTGNTFTSGAVGIQSTGASGSAPIVIVSQPVITSVAIAPDNPNAATTLTATPSGVDPDGGTLSFTYQWFLGTTAIGGATSNQLTLSTVTGLQTGSVITVQVTPVDGTLTGSAFTSGNVDIQNIGPPIVITLPTVTNVVITPPSPGTTDTLTATPTGTNPEGGTLSYTYQWLDSTGTAISGQTSSTLNLATLAGVVANDTFSVNVTPSDGTLTGTLFTSSPVTVA